MGVVLFLSQPGISLLLFLFLSYIDLARASRVMLENNRNRYSCLFLVWVGVVQSFISKSHWHVSVSNCSRMVSQCSSLWNIFTVKHPWHFLDAFTQVAVEVLCGICSSFHDCRALLGEIFKCCSTLALLGYTPFVDSFYDFCSLLGLVSSELNFDSILY